MEHNPTQHFSELKIGRKVYKLTFDLNAVATAEKITRQSLLFGVVWSELCADKLVGVLYAALLRAQPEITVEDVRKMITPRNAMAITAALYEAWFKNEAEPEEGAVEADPQQPKA